MKALVRYYLQEIPEGYKVCMNVFYQNPASMATISLKTDVEEKAIQLAEKIKQEILESSFRVNGLYRFTDNLECVKFEA